MQMNETLVLPFTPEWESLNRTAAHIAAAALVEVFPGIELMGEENSSIGFAYTFFSEKDLPFQAVELIEMQMRQIIREKRIIRSLEMVPVSARALLKKEGRLQQAEQIEGKGLVELVQIGSFCALGTGAFLKNSAQVGGFKLFSIESIGDRGFCLSGVAASSKDELNLFLKKLRAYFNQNHITVGVQKGFWRVLKGEMTGEVIWLKEGLLFLEEIKNTLRTHLLGKTLEVSANSLFEETRPYLSLCELLQVGAVSEFYQLDSQAFDPEIGFLEGEGGIQLNLFAPLFSKTVIESFLHSIQKTLMILGFKPRFLVKGKGLEEEGVLLLTHALQGLKFSFEKGGSPCLEFLVKDSLGREWCVFAFRKQGKSFLLDSSLERLIALLLEKSLSEQTDGEKS
jgi:hypothetical protein